jgi:hypothetical protein
MRQAQSFNDAMRTWTPPLPPFPMLPPGLAPESEASGAPPLPAFMDPTTWFAPWLEMFRPRDPS